MPSIHIAELTFHKIMNQVEKENPKISDADMVVKARERINELLKDYITEIEAGV